MKSVNGMQQDIIILQHVRLDEYYDKYRQIAFGATTRVVASTLEPLEWSEGNPRTYDCIIYFEKKEDESVNARKELKLTM